MNYWYVARANELFIDTDNASKSLAHTRARLQGAIECGKLDVAYVMQRPSTRPDHLHTIVTLQHGLPSPARFVWEIVLHGDIYRGCCNLMRAFTGGEKTADILISPYNVFLDEKHDFAHEKQVCDDTCHCRWHDDACDCIGKHTAAVMKTCPAAIRLRGDKRAVGFFGKPSKNPCKWL